MDTMLHLRFQSERTKQRRAYYQKNEAQLARWRADLLALEANMAEASVNEQMVIQQQIRSLKEKLAQAEERLDDMKEATGDTWAKLQISVDTLQEELADSVDEAQQMVTLSGIRS